MRMPRKRTPDYGKVLSIRAQGDDLKFVLAETKDGRKKPADVLREALHALRKARAQKGQAA
jgi:hypothetical protein